MLLVADQLAVCSRKLAAQHVDGVLGRYCHVSDDEFQSLLLLLKPEQAERVANELNIAFVERCCSEGPDFDTDKGTSTRRL